MGEQRVIGQKIGARPAPSVASGSPDAPSGGAGKRKGHRLVVVLVIVAVVVLAAGAYLVVLRPHGTAGAAQAPKPTPTPVAGEVLNVDPVSVNLAGGHYLRLGLALQLSTAEKAKPDPARALDLAIALYSGRSVDEVSAPATRDQLKGQLLAELQQAYGEGVMDVYLTDYVTQ